MFTKGPDVFRCHGSADDRLINNSQTKLFARLDDIGRRWLRLTSFVVGTVDNNTPITGRLERGHVFRPQLGRNRQGIA